MAPAEPRNTVAPALFWTVARGKLRPHSQSPRPRSLRRTRRHQPSDPRATNLRALSGRRAQTRPPPRHRRAAA